MPQLTITIDSKQDGLDIVYQLANAAAYCEHRAERWGALSGKDGDEVDVELRRQADVFRKVGKEIARQVKNL